MLCEEGTTPIKAQSALLVPQISKSTITMKPYTKIGKIDKHCTNYGWNKHNVKMCKIKKKEEPTVITTEVTNQFHKSHNNNSYAYHICVSIGIRWRTVPSLQRCRTCSKGKMLRERC